MCFDHDSQPPIPEGTRDVTGRDLTLIAEDGNEFMGFEVTGEEESPKAVIVLPDVRGLYQFYKDLATRFGEAGYDAIAIDYFGRTAGLGDRPNDWDFMPHVQATTVEGIRHDVGAAAARLRASEPDRRLFTVGFCFGGSNSWHQAANHLSLSGAIGFYGRPHRSDNDSVISRVGEMTCPILGLMGGADPSIPQSAIDEFASALDSAGVPNEFVVYPGAPHSFFDRKYAEFAEESADAWSRAISFIDDNA